MEAERLSTKIKAVIDALPSDRVDVADIRDLFGQEGIMLLTAFLTIPFMIPISIPGASTVFGAVILLVVFSRLCGRNLWLPKRIEQQRIPAYKLRACLHQGLIFFSSPRTTGASLSTEMVYLKRDGEHPEQPVADHGSLTADGTLRAHTFQQHPARLGTSFSCHRLFTAGRRLHSARASGQFCHHRLFCVSHWRWQCSIPRLIRIFIKVVSVNFPSDSFMRLELRPISSSPLSVHELSLRLLKVQWNSFRLLRLCAAHLRYLLTR